MPEPGQLVTGHLGLIQRPDQRAGLSTFEPRRSLGSNRGSGCAARAIGALEQLFGPNYQAAALAASHLTDRNLKFADSPLEGDRFELLVPRQAGNGFAALSERSGHARGRWSQWRASSDWRRMIDATRSGRTAISKSAGSGRCAAWRDR